VLLNKINDYNELGVRMEKWYPGLVNFIKYQDRLSSYGVNMYLVINKIIEQSYNRPLNVDSVKTLSDKNIVSGTLFEEDYLHDIFKQTENQLKGTFPEYLFDDLEFINT
jgi:hypothetical protein